MSHRVLISELAEKEIKKIPKPFYEKIRQAILALGSNPRPNGCKKLKGREGYRIRVADYRVVYDVNDKIVTVYILTVMNRKDVYKK
jgi:mRNA interferase RelE/StbE